MNVNDTRPLTDREFKALVWQVDSIKWAIENGYERHGMMEELLMMIRHRIGTDMDRLLKQQKASRTHLRLTFIENK